MKPIREKIRTTGDSYIFHDTRGDIRTLMKYCNMLADKVNELNEELQVTKKEYEYKLERIIKPD